MIFMMVQLMSSSSYNLLHYLIPEWFNVHFLVPVYPGSPTKKADKTSVVVLGFPDGRLPGNYVDMLSNMSSYRSVNHASN